MDDASRMRFGKSLRNLNGDVESVVHRQWPPRDPLLQCLALVIGHGDELLALRRGIDLVNRADVGMVQGGRRLGFPNEALTGVVVAGQLRGKKLEGHEAVELGVLGFVDDPHAAPAELLEHAIVGDRSPFHDATPQSNVLPEEAHRIVAAKGLLKP